MTDALKSGTREKVMAVIAIGMIFAGPYVAVGFIQEGKWLFTTITLVITVVVSAPLLYKLVK